MAEQFARDCTRERTRSQRCHHSGAHAERLAQPTEVPTPKIYQVALLVYHNRIGLMVAPEYISWRACSKSSSCTPSSESETGEAGSSQRCMRTLKNFATLSIGNFPSWYHWIISGMNCALSTMRSHHSSVHAYLFGEAVPFHTPHQKHPCLWSIRVSRFSVPGSWKKCK